MPDGPRYDDDFYAWTQHQAAVLRSMEVADNRFDREHVAEEIEDLGKSERYAVRSQIRRILDHFLKLAHSPAATPRFDWIESIEDARETLEDKSTATLHRDAAEALNELYERSRRKVARALRQFGEVEAADGLPQACPYSLEDIFREDWNPDWPGAQP
jgi:Domain of unknown function DUF29